MAFFVEDTKGALSYGQRADENHIFSCIGPPGPVMHLETASTVAKYRRRL